jgi:hypothetical protein
MTALDQARIQEIRYQLLTLLDSCRPDGAGENLLLRGLKSLQVTPDDLRRELLYLKQRELLSLQPPTNPSDGSTAALLSLGVDFLEGNAPHMAGVVLPETPALGRIELERRKEVRWRLLRVCDINRPQPLNESLAQRAIHDINLIVTHAELRRIAVYLEQKGLLLIHRRSDWAFELSADAIDICEYSRDCPVGIGRPERYW